ncbi:RAD5, partial [Symbiodinium pilosum]
MASKDEAWTKLLERSFSSPRRGLVGPRAWKAVVPVVGRRYPDEIFSFLRGAGCLNGPGPAERLSELRRCGDRGWQPFFANLTPEEGLQVRDGLAVVDFLQNAHVPTCRRISYRLNEDASGIDIRLEVNLHRAFAMMLRGIRFPAAGYEADWRIWPGPPKDLQPAPGSAAFRLLDNKLDARHAQPPNFRVQLRPEQLRSLHWMLHQEISDQLLTMARSLDLCG